MMVTVNDDSDNLDSNIDTLLNAIQEKTSGKIKEHMHPHASGSQDTQVDLPQAFELDIHDCSCIEVHH